MRVCEHFEEIFRENAAVIADSYGGLTNYVGILGSVLTLMGLYRRK